MIEINLIEHNLQIATRDLQIIHLLIHILNLKFLSQGDIQLKIITFFVDLQR